MAVGVSGDLDCKDHDIERCSAQATAYASFADNSRHDSAWAADLYRKARARGKRHPHTIRILMRAWMRVIWACWDTGTAYDPAHHGGELRLAKAAA